VKVLQRLLYHSVACLTWADEGRSGDGLSGGGGGGKPPPGVPSSSSSSSFPLRFLLSRCTLAKLESSRALSEATKAEARRRLRSDDLEDMLGYVRAVCKLMPILRTPSSQSPDDHHYQVDQQLRGSGVPSLQKFFLESSPSPSSSSPSGSKNRLLPSGESFLETVKEQLRSELAPPREDTAFRNHHRHHHNRTSSTAAASAAAAAAGSRSAHKHYHHHHLPSSSSSRQGHHLHARGAAAVADGEVAGSERAVAVDREYVDPRRVLRDRRMCEEMFLRTEAHYSLLCPYVETLSALLSCEGEEDAVVLERSEEQGVEISHKAGKPLTLQTILRFDDPLRGWLPGLPWTEEQTYMSMRDVGVYIYIYI
jgi:hypothetical protein